MASVPANDDPAARLTAMKSGMSILIWLWGAATMALWFLAWNSLGADIKIPNAFLAFAIISTLAAAIVAYIQADSE